MVRMTEDCFCDKKIQCINKLFKQAHQRCHVAVLLDLKSVKGALTRTVHQVKSFMAIEEIITRKYHLSGC